MRALSIAVLIALVAAACGGRGAPPSAIRSAPRPSVAASAPLAPVVTPDASRPVFLTTSLTDVRTGAPFTIGGFPGKVVIVIAMAVW